MTGVAMMVATTGGVGLGAALAIAVVDHADRGRVSPEAGLMALLGLSALGAAVLVAVAA